MTMRARTLAAGTVAAMRATGRLMRDVVLPPRVRHGEHATVIDHLEELRHRMLVCLLAFVPAFAICWGFHGRIITALTRPLPSDIPMPVTFGVAEPFMLSMRISAIAALAMLLPLLVWHIWAYCAPAFAPDAQRSVWVFGVAGAALFACGIAFGYLVALPGALAFLTHFDRHLYDVQLRAMDYYNFMALSLVAIGAVFELPIVLLGLVRFGVIGAATLRTSRRTGYAIAAAIAVALPGVDPVMTLVEAIPLIALYEATIVVAAVSERRWNRQRDAARIDRDSTHEHHDDTAVVAA